MEKVKNGVNDPYKQSELWDECHYIILDVESKSDCEDLLHRKHSMLGEWSTKLQIWFNLG